MIKVEEALAVLEEAGLVVRKGKVQLSERAEAAVDRFLWRRSLAIMIVAGLIGAAIGGAVQSYFVSSALDEIANSSKLTGHANGRLESETEHALRALDRASATAGEAREEAERVRVRASQVEKDLASILRTEDNRKKIDQAVAAVLEGPQFRTRFDVAVQDLKNRMISLEAGLRENPPIVMGRPYYLRLPNAFNGDRIVVASDLKDHTGRSPVLGTTSLKALKDGESPREWSVVTIEPLEIGKR